MEANGAVTWEPVTFTNASVHRMTIVQNGVTKTLEKPVTSGSAPQTCGAFTMACNAGTCEDTPGWSNARQSGGVVSTCADYSADGWCCDGGACPGQEWALGSYYNNPEQNCCACGKAPDVEDFCDLFNPSVTFWGFASGCSLRMG